MRDVLRLRGMRTLLIGETTSTFGDWALLLALAIWVKTLTHSNSLAGLVLLAMTAPSLAAPIYGWVSDRFRRRPFLITINLLSALAIASLLVVDSRRDVWIVFVVVVLYGVSSSITGGAFSGLVKELVPDAKLGAANGMFSTVRQGMQLIGPLAGAGLFAAYGGHLVAIVDIASFAVAAVALSAIHVTEERPERVDQHWVNEVSAGIAHVWRERVLRSTTISIGVGLLALGAVNTIVFAYIDQGLHRSPSFLGVLLTAQGIGAVVGALAAPRIMVAAGEVAAVAFGMTAFGVGIGLLIYPSVILALIAMPVAGLANTVAFVSYSTMLQRRTPGAIMGRVSAAANMVTGASQTLSMAAGAAIIAVVDFRTLFAVITAALLINGALLSRRGRMAHDVTLPEEPAAASVAPIAVGGR
jgi:Na+/melibiose symporter-like transporter